jgi:hypothetical protein
LLGSSAMQPQPSIVSKPLRGCQDEPAVSL